MKRICLLYMKRITQMWTCHADTFHVLNTFHAAMKRSTCILGSCSPSVHTRHSLRQHIELVLALRKLESEWKIQIVWSGILTKPSLSDCLNHCKYSVHFFS